MNQAPIENPSAEAEDAESLMAVSLVTGEPAVRRPEDAGRTVAGVSVGTAFEAVAIGIVLVVAGLSLLRRRRPRSTVGEEGAFLALADALTLDGAQIDRINRRARRERVSAVALLVVRGPRAAA